MSAETKFKIGDVITDGLVNGEITGEKLAPKTEEKPKLAAFVEVAQKLENEPVEMKGNKDLKDYAGMNPEAAAVMGWPDKDHAIELDEHQSETVRTKNLVHETVEQEEMKQGETYHDAHLDALKAETTIKTPEHLAEKVQEIRERPAKKGNHPKIVKVHDDGDLTVKKGDANYVVTTEGKTFKEVKPEPELKDVIQHSHELGEKATRGGQEVSRGPHKAEKAGSIPAPATKPPEQPEQEGHPISEAENRAIHAWYGEHGESNHGGKRHMGILTTKQREALPDSAFAIPEERKYPIHDKNHARAALARVAEFGTPEEKQRVAKAIKDRYPEEETLNSYATAKADGHKIMMTSLKDSPHHPVAPKGSRVSMSNAAPHLTKPHMTRKGRGLTRRSDR